MNNLLCLNNTTPIYIITFFSCRKSKENPLDIVYIIFIVVGIAVVVERMK